MRCDQLPGVSVGITSVVDVGTGVKVCVGSGVEVAGTVVGVLVLACVVDVEVGVDVLVLVEAASETTIWTYTICPKALPLALASRQYPV